MDRNVTTEARLGAVQTKNVQHMTSANHRRRANYRHRTRGRNGRTASGGRGHSSSVTPSAKSFLSSNVFQMQIEMLIPALVERVFTMGHLGKPEKSRLIVLDPNYLQNSSRGTLRRLPVESVPRESRLSVNDIPVTGGTFKFNASSTGQCFTDES